MLSLITVTVAISFFSLVLQELAPKRLALQRPESLALIAAPLLDRISVLARPLVWLLSSPPTWWCGCSAATRQPAAT